MAPRKLRSRYRLTARVAAALCLALALLGLAPPPVPLSAAEEARFRTFLPVAANHRPPRLAFVRFEGSRLSHYAIGADGSGLSTLIGPDHPTSYDSFWSPDRRRLAMLERFTVGGTWYGSLWVMEVSSFARRRLTGDTFSVSSVGWSPDSRSLVFVASEGDPLAEPVNLYTIGADGAGLASLTDEPGFKCEPAWSPDGRSIAFLSVAPSGESLQLIGADGQGRRTLLGGPGAQLTGLSWSPDSRWLALRGSDSSAALALHRVSPDGTGHRLLARDVLLKPNSWSPDGRWLVAERIVGGGLTELVAVGAEDGALRVLIPASFALSWSVVSAAWSPTGDVIAFSHPGPDGFVISLVGADGRGLRELTLGEQPVWLP
ncbi:MAG TPA: hypothetical protein PKD53_11210 [Chloroflexaceae bacterium]|nr:hypothetical protein [Chloroflexaceae bacterium]